MERTKNLDQIPSVYLTSVFGAEQILKKIQSVPQKEKILLKNDDFLKKKRNRNVLVDQMEFFIPEQEMEHIAKEMETLFLPRKEQGAMDAECVEGQVQICTSREQRATKVGSRNPLCISLEIIKNPYRIPMDLHLIPYARTRVYPKEHTGTGVLDKETFTYYKFPPEEYLALGFYEILNGLNLISDLSWYKDIFQILTKEPLEGRKIWEGLNEMLAEHPLSSLECRMDAIMACRDNMEMKKRWKSQSRRSGEHYPNWEQVVSLIGAFFTPIYEGILKDEIFLGDWMPQLGRYLD